MRTLRFACVAIVAMACMPAVSEAHSRWGVSFGFGSGGYHGSGLSIGYGYSHGYRPSFVHGGYSRACYAPVAYRPVYYAPRPVYHSTPAYCPPPVYYSSPSYHRGYDHGYSAPVYYSTPRFRDTYSHVSVNYSSGYRHHHNYRSYDRDYSYCQPASSYGYSSYYRR